MSTTTPSTRLGLAVLRAPDDREAWDEHLGMMERTLTRVLKNCSYTIGPIDAGDLHEVINRVVFLREGLAVEQ